MGNRRKSRLSRAGAFATTLIALTLAHAIAPTPLRGQNQTWTVSAFGGLVEADGHFSAVRPNGKRITSDIDGGAFYALSVGRRVSARWSVVLGYEGSRQRRYSVAQDFPDGTSFSSSDSFDYHAVNAGASIDVGSLGEIDLSVEPYLSLGFFGDVSLDVAGPPYDRSTPLAIDVTPRLGGGVAASAAIPFGGSGAALVVRTGVTLHSLTGDFPADPALPGSEGSIDTPFNPAYLVIGVALRS